MKGKVMFDWGLSPLARGKRFPWRGSRPSFGPIPAGAGETLGALLLPRLPGAYPRWRGGNTAWDYSGGREAGLSPLARGKHPQSCLTSQTQGPIPAGAGETSPTTSTNAMPRAYPRWRGGNGCGQGPLLAREGLSPLARGKPEGGGGGHRFQGPIPAGAGETRLAKFLPLSVEGLSPLARGKLNQPELQPDGSGPIPAGAGETCLFES